MALHMVSLVLLVILSLLDAYFAVGLYDNVRYTATVNGGTCSWIGGLQVLGVVPPWVFLALGAAATVQVLFQGRFRISVVFLCLQMAHMTLLLCLMVLASSFCAGAPVLPVIRSFSSQIILVLLFATLPLPLLVLQRRAIRIGRTDTYDRL